MHSSKSPNNLNEYIVKLMEYVKILSIMPRLGKLLLCIDDLEIRQIIYKKHIVVYSIKGDKIKVLLVIHTSRGVKKIIEDLRNNNDIV